MTRLALCAAALSLCACASDLSSPFSAVAVTWDPQQQGFHLAKVKLGTLSSLRRLRGASGTVTAGGRVRIASAAVLDPSATVESLRARFIEAPAASVDLAWNMIDGVAWPEDFTSLELLTTYSGVERARQALAQWGAADLPARPIVAHADIEDERGLSPLPAGELYSAPLGTFFVPAPSAQQQMPPAFNPGVVAHALGHEAVQELAWNGAAASAPELGSDDGARHLARSLAEGIADYLAVAASGDPQWFNHSQVQDAGVRTLDQVRCSNPAMLDALAVSDADAPYDPYPLGAVLAGALWEQASAANADELSRSVIAALPAAGATFAGSLAQVLDVLAAHAPADQRDGLCALFLNRFGAMGISATQVPTCAAATPRKECR